MKDHSFSGGAYTYDAEKALWKERDRIHVIYQFGGICRVKRSASIDKSRTPDAFTVIA